MIVISFMNLNRQNDFPHAKERGMGLGERAFRRAQEKRQSAGGSSARRDPAEIAALQNARQRLGVRLSSAALVSASTLQHFNTSTI